MSRELPIIFDAESVRAILAGRKTQTRRVVKPFPDVQCIKLHQHGDEWLESWSEHGIPCYRGNVWMRHKSPYRKDDLLWMKETWAAYQILERSYEGSGCEFAYKADGHDTVQQLRYHISLLLDVSLGAVEIKNMRYHSPVTMPKTATRIWLRVTDVRAERLQDIDAAGIIGEGVFQEIADDPGYDNLSVAQVVFGAVWDRHNAKKGYPWEDNHWVWVYEFKVERIKK